VFDCYDFVYFTFITVVSYHYKNKCLIYVCLIEEHEEKEGFW